MCAAIALSPSASRTTQGASNAIGSNPHNSAHRRYSLQQQQSKGEGSGQRGSGQDMGATEAAITAIRVHSSNRLPISETTIATVTKATETTAAAATQTARASPVNPRSCRRAPGSSGGHYRVISGVRWRSHSQSAVTPVTPRDTGDTVVTRRAGRIARVTGAGVGPGSRVSCA